jgi:hypothetical protein
METVDIVDITNIGNSTVQIGVSEPEIVEVGTGTETTALDITGNSLLYDGSGTVTIYPGKRFVIEEYRINLGQLQNYIDRKQVRALFMTRSIDNLTDRS